MTAPALSAEALQSMPLRTLQTRLTEARRGFVHSTKPIELARARAEIAECEAEIKRRGYVLA